MSAQAGVEAGWRAEDEGLGHPLRLLVVITVRGFPGLVDFALPYQQAEEEFPRKKPGA